MLTSNKADLWFWQAILPTLGWLFTLQKYYSDCVWFPFGSASALTTFKDRTICAFESTEKTACIQQFINHVFMQSCVCHPIDIFLKEQWRGSKCTVYYLDGQINFRKMKILDFLKVASKLKASGSWYGNQMLSQIPKFSLCCWGRPDV